MKANLLLILSAGMMLAYGCKTEEVKPQSASVSTSKPDSTVSVTTSGPTTGTVANPGGGAISTPIGSPNSSTPLDPKTLVAKWSLVKDSIYDSMGNFPAPRTSGYNGVEGDYVDFRADGKCYTKEGNTYDTLAYQVTASNQVIIQKFGLCVNGNYEPNTMTQVSDNIAMIQTQWLPTPDGFYMRCLFLKK